MREVGDDPVFHVPRGISHDRRDIPLSGYGEPIVEFLREIGVSHNIDEMPRAGIAIANADVIAIWDVLQRVPNLFEIILRNMPRLRRIAKRFARDLDWAGSEYRSVVRDFKDYCKALNGERVDRPMAVPVDLFCANSLNEGVVRDIIATGFRFPESSEDTAARYDASPVLRVLSPPEERFVDLARIAIESGARNVALCFESGVRSMYEICARVALDSPLDIGGSGEGDSIYAKSR
jgi:hypothetical protein